MATAYEKQGGKEQLFHELPSEVLPAYPTPWPALIVTRSEIEGEIQRLTSLDRRPNARRASEIVHPSSIDSGAAVTPGLSVAINVVLPGEQVELYRDNGTRVEFVLQGEGTAAIGVSKFALAKWGVNTVPSMTKRTYRNDGPVPLVWLSYSNVPLLKRLGTYYSDSRLSVPLPPLSERSAIEQRYVAKTAPDYPILSDGARLRGYEFVTDIEVVENKALSWPWSETSPHLSLEEGDGKRSLMLLVNPATGRRQGATHSFLAALSRSPANELCLCPRGGTARLTFAGERLRAARKLCVAP